MPLLAHLIPCPILTCSCFLFCHQSLLYLDKKIGELIDKLEAGGWMENSIIAVASDNGGCVVDGGTNYPLRGGKQSMFEGGTRVRHDLIKGLGKCLSWSFSVCFAKESSFMLGNFTLTILGGGRLRSNVARRQAMRCLDVRFKANFGMPLMFITR